MPLEVFDKDAENGFLSHSKMLDVTNKRHLRIAQEKAQKKKANNLGDARRGTITREDFQFKNFACCGTNTGWFC